MPTLRSPFTPAMLPLLLLGLIVGAYWYRVLRMARKARKRTGRAANFLPPEPLGRVLRIVWMPVIFVWIVHPLVAAVIASRLRVTAPLWSCPVCTWTGVAIAGACFLATRYCWRRMGTAWRMGIDPNEQNTLVTTGPFAYVRHPIYALSATMMLASALALPTPLMLAAAVVHVSLLYWEARREERHMLRTHGPIYGDYLKRVGRFAPRSLRPFQASPVGDH